MLLGEGDFGEVARKRGYVTDDQLLQALDLQVLTERHLGRRPSMAEVLFLRGELTIEQVRTVLHDIGVPAEMTSRMHERALFGKLCVDRGYITPDQLLQGLAIQEGEIRRGQALRPLGVILGAKGFITREQLKEVLRDQHLKTLSGTLIKKPPAPPERSGAPSA